MAESKENGAEVMEGYSEDIEKFCNEVIMWKTAACKRDEIFSLFRENPYYLFGYLCYSVRKNEERQNNLNLVLLGLTAASIFTSLAALGMTSLQAQAENNPNSIYIQALFVIAAFFFIYMAIKIRNNPV
ncbi:MAG: hypothetical protein LUQ04_11065 [Methanoregula sp.]|nr:hypothetical protein [Methanoregula sp.]